ncbi:MAG: arginase [Proteobacteria bacterium]|nr:arginase [Pseudomonadota bacterium]
MRLRLLDLDGSAAMQAAAAELGSPIQKLDFVGLGPQLRLWASRRAMAEFADRLRGAAEPPGDGPILTLLGSGDYHHLSAALIAATETPLTVVHFDNHPDWVRFAPAFHCGSWINRVLELPNVQRVVTIGPCSDDLVRPQFKGGNLAALSAGRLELYPWRHAPSAVWGCIGSGPSFSQRDGQLIWRNVGCEDWQDFLEELLPRIPTERIWITIDKDVLSMADAATNWDQGEMPLAALLVAVRTLARGKCVQAVDVCGDYSPPRFDRNLVKRWEAWRDHPPAPPAADLARNVATNRALIATLQDALR